MRNVSDIESLTPYDLLERGRLDDVEYLAAHLPTGSPPRSATAPRCVPPRRRAPTRIQRLPPDATSHSPILPPADEEGWEEVEAEAIDNDE